MDGDGGEGLLKWLVLIAIAGDDVLAQAIIPHAWHDLGMATGQIERLQTFYTC